MNLFYEGIILTAGLYLPAEAMGAIGLLPLAGAERHHETGWPWASLLAC